MKSIIKSLAILSILVLFTGNIFAEQPPVVRSMNTLAVEKNLIQGVDSDNTGLKVSSAYQLGEIKSEKAVLPLLKMLRNGENEEERIAAALSLTKIGTDKALYFVKSAARFDQSKRVRELCNKFYVNTIRG